MSNFCSNCRFPLAASAGFCPQCGRPQATSQQPPNYPPPPYPPQYPPPTQAAPTGGGSAAKVVIIVVVCLAVAGAAVLGAGYYAFYKVKKTVVAKAGSYGVDLNSIPSPRSSSNSSRRKVYKPCEMLSKSEVSSLLGQPIERTEVMDAACLYFGPAGLAEKLAERDTSDMMAQAKAGKQLNGGDVADTVTKMLGAAAAKSGEGVSSHGEVPLLTFLVDPDGRSQMTAVAATKGIFGKIGEDSGAGGLGADIPNLGDRAIRLGPLGLNVLKGDTVIRVIVGPVPGANEKSVAIARAALPRI